MSYLAYSGILMLIIAGIAKGVKDTLVHHYGKSIFSKFKNQDWWDPEISWRNKYKDRKNTVLGNIIEWLDNTLLVSFTDAWHTFQSIEINCLMIGVYTLGMEGNLYLFLLGTILYHITFEINYKWILLR